MSEPVSRLGVWSAAIIAMLVILIDVDMIASAILYPMTTITSIESYESSFGSLQMLPFIPSLLLAPLFVVMMHSIHQTAPQEKKAHNPTWLFI
jgi:hypothetical protein